MHLLSTSLIAIQALILVADVGGKPTLIKLPKEGFDCDSNEFFDHSE
jgi:hypothetical protein